jgi:hypothetical protein
LIKIPIKPEIVALKTVAVEYFLLMKPLVSNLDETVDGKALRKKNS